MQLESNSLKTQGQRGTSLSLIRDHGLIALDMRELAARRGETFDFVPHDICADLENKSR